MRKYVLMMLVVGVAAAGAVGCSDDAVSGEEGVVDAGADSGSASPDSSGGDPTDTGPTPDVWVAHDTGGSEDGGDEGADAGPDAGLDSGLDSGAPDASDAGVEPDVSEVACAYPSSDPSCPTGDFGPASFIDTIRIVPQQDCCRDFDGDGTQDNQIGSLLNAASAVGGGNVNAEIAAAIAAGRIVYLLEFANWGHPAYDPALDARFLLGADDGQGGYLVDPASYGLAGQPLYAFGSGEVAQGVLTAEGGALSLEFPGLLPQVEILLTDVRIESADVAVPADLTAGGQVTLQSGKMSGILERDTLFESLNVASNACSCLQTDAFTWNATSSKWECALTDAHQSACANDPNASGGCQQLASTQLCGMFALLSGSVDVNAANPMDASAPHDAYSVGIEFHGTGASISGALP